jgi:hypothetical protein
MKDATGIAAVLTHAQILAAAVATAEPKKPRPFEVTASSTQAIQRDSQGQLGEAHAAAVGFATHLGLVVMIGTADYRTEAPGTGYIVAANGDFLTMVFNATGPTTIETVITGGVGRFEGAKGHFTITVQVLSQESDPTTGTVTLKMSWQGKGEIEY